MTTEIEAKLKVDALDPVREQLREIGATFIRSVTEHNSLYDWPDGRLRKNDSVLRVRELEIRGGSPSPSTLTYKGPRTPGRFKQRPEMELRIDDAAAATALLEALGFLRMMRFEKRRDTWTWRGCEVALDDVPCLGTFVEIEGPDVQAIDTVQSDLGLANRDHIREGYVRLLHDWCRARNHPFDEITFE